MVEIRQATREDIAAHYGGVPASMRAIVAVVDGEIMGIAGLRYTPYGLVAFSEMAPGAERFPVSTMRCARMLVQMIRQCQAPVYAMAGNDKTAPKFLARLGFVPTISGAYLWEH